MYKLETARKEKALEPPPFGPGFKQEEIPGDAVNLEVWASSYDDAGDDFCEFRLVDAKGNTLVSRKVEGY